MTPKENHKYMKSTQIKKWTVVFVHGKSSIEDTNGPVTPKMPPPKFKLRLFNTW